MHQKRLYKCSIWRHGGCAKESWKGHTIKRLRHYIFWGLIMSHIDAVIKWAIQTFRVFYRTTISWRHHFHISGQFSCHLLMALIVIIHVYCNKGLRVHYFCVNALALFWAINTAWCVFDVTHILKFMGFFCSRLHLYMYASTTNTLFNVLACTGVDLTANQDELTDTETFQVEFEKMFESSVGNSKARAP